MGSGIGGEESGVIEVRSGIPEVRSRSGCNFGIVYHTHTSKAKSEQHASYFKVTATFMKTTKGYLGR